MDDKHIVYLFNERSEQAIGELAKKYGADASSGFINGVLAKLVEA